MYGRYPIVDVMCDSVNLPHVEGLPYDEINAVLLTEEIILSTGYKHTNTLHSGGKVFSKPGYQTIYFLNGILRYSTACSMVYLHEWQNAHKVFHWDELELSFELIKTT